METTSLVVEFLVIGLFPFLTIVFAILSSFNVLDFAWITNINDISAFLIIFSTILIYTLGAVFHRIIQIFNTNTASFLFRFKFVRKITGQKEPTQLKKWWKLYCFVYENISDNFIRRLEFEESLLRIFRSTALTAPLLSISLGIWLSKMGCNNGALHQ